MKEEYATDNKPVINIGDFTNIDENKVKLLESRMTRRSSLGKNQVEVESNAEVEQDSVITVNNVNMHKEQSNKNENLLNEKETNVALNLESNNSNKSNRSLSNSLKRKTPPRKAEKKTKTSGNLQINFLSTKRNRQESNSNTNSNHNIEQVNPHEEFIEFSSKNIVTQPALFSKTKENATMMTNFLIKNGQVPKSEHKINEYFKSTQSSAKEFSLNNISNLQTPENRQGKQKVQEEVEKLNKELNEKNKQMNDKDREIDKLKVKCSEYEDNLKNILMINKQFEQQLLFAKVSLVKNLKELEENKRVHKKKWLNEQQLRLGRIAYQRTSHNIIEYWEEGEEFCAIKKRLTAIMNDKEDIEKQKKNLQNYQKRRTQTDGMTEQIENETNDLKDLLTYKTNMLNREEIELKEKYEKLEIDKTLYLIERNRFSEELKCRYGSSQRKDPWPVLSNRYAILSLLGNGGYSEVYKAYDLENHIEVACKIHQLNPQWSDTMKDNYIKHTIRENQIHKEINHPKIVRHYDTIEIDNNSFCTVLEYCTGPDLSTYLKIHKALSEKEAKLTISQILSGLEYLNKQQKKIIHYDLKPQNIIFHNMEIKISDFGLAKIIDNNSDKIELTSQGVGTYWYLPPECFEQGRTPPGISSKVDIWSVGVILYEMLFMKKPFGNSCTQEKILKEGVMLNAKRVEFPAKPVISDDCKVRIIF